MKTPDSSMKFFKRVKDDSVVVDGISSEMIFAWGVVCGAYASHMNLANCVVTSGNDGTHRSDSRHYSNDALDFRVWGFPVAMIDTVASTIQRLLGDEYVVVNELDHIHVEFERTSK